MLAIIPLCILLLLPSLVPGVEHADRNFLINPKHACGTGDLDLVVWVHSAPRNVRQRNAIRATWANPHMFTGGYGAKTIFFIGKPMIVKSPEEDGAMNSTISHYEIFSNRLNEDIQHRLEYEAEMYGDMVQGDFIDSYRNMTYKAIHALRWISLYCQNAKFIMKTDDDVIVNMFKLLPYMQLKKEKQYYPQYSLLCNVWKNSPPARDPSNKWYISENEYPREVYPPFCQGMVYFLSHDMPVKLYNASLSVEYIFMDDVYVTGLLTEVIHNPPITFKQLHPEFARTYGIGEKLITAVRTKKGTFFHADSVDLYLESWEILRSLKDEKPTNARLKAKSKRMVGRPALRGQ